LSGAPFPLGTRRSSPLTAHPGRGHGSHPWRPRMLGFVAAGYLWEEDGVVDVRKERASNCLCCRHATRSAFVASTRGPIATAAGWLLCQAPSFAAMGRRGENPMCATVRSPIRAGVLQGDVRKKSDRTTGAGSCDRREFAVVVSAPPRIRLDAWSASSVY
jgi:hypothetical protein